MDTTTRLIRNSSKRSKNVKAILSNSESISIWQSERELARWKMCLFLRDKDKEEEEKELAASAARLVSDPESDAHWGVRSQHQEPQPSCDQREKEEYLQQVEAYYMSNIYTKELFPRTYRENMVLQPVNMQDLSLFNETICKKYYKNNNNNNSKSDEALTLTIVAPCLLFSIFILMFVL